MSTNSNVNRLNISNSTATNTTTTSIISTNYIQTTVSVGTTTNDVITYRRNEETQ